MEVDLDASTSVAGGALAVVQQANEKERNSFDAQSEAQREQVLSASAWGFCKVRFLLITSRILGQLSHQV